jgi:hypothetical protein
MRNPIDLRLGRHGVILLLLGMLTGFVITKFNNRGIGNAAHITGLIGGYGMIAMGLLWPSLSLGRRWSGAGAWITAVSLYLNWLGLVLRGSFGSGLDAANSSPLGSALQWDFAAQITLGMAILLSLLSVLIVLMGLRKLGAPADSTSELIAANATR